MEGSGPLKAEADRSLWVDTVPARNPIRTLKPFLGGAEFRPCGVSWVTLLVGLESPTKDPGLPEKVWQAVPHMASLSSWRIRLWCKHDAKRLVSSRLGIGISIQQISGKRTLPCPLE